MRKTLDAIGPGPEGRGKISSPVLHDDGPITKPFAERWPEVNRIAEKQRASAKRGPKKLRLSSLINKAELRRRATVYAMDNKYNFRLKGIRISEITFAEAEAVLWNWMKRKVDAAPSRGKTI
jgi:hypothetical protein